MKWLIVALVLIAAMGIGFGLAWALDTYEDEDDKQ